MSDHLLLRHVSFPCPDCVPRTFCTTCCSIGVKHMGYWVTSVGRFALPRDPNQRKRMAAAYRKFMEREVT